MTLDLADYILKSVLPKTFVEGASDNTLKLGLFLIDDMMENLGYAILSSLWVNFIEVFFKYCTHRSTDVRQAACFGLGIYAQNSPA